MDVKTAQELFNERIPQSLAKAPDKAREIGVVYGFKITGDGGGEWTVDLASATPSCMPGIKGTPNCTIEVGHADLMELVSGKDPGLGMKLYFQQKLKVSGDPMLATKLTKLFSLG